MQPVADYSHQVIGGKTAAFVQEAMPYSNWGLTYFNIRLMELSLIDSLLDGPIRKGGQRALDFGCGLGLASAYMSEYFESVDGVDIEDIGVAFNVDSPAPVVGQQIMTSIGANNVSLYCTDTESFLRDHPDHYDFILTIFALEHIKEIESVCRTLARAMRPGALAVHIVPNTHDTIIQLLQQNLQPIEDNERNLVHNGRGLRKLGSLYAPITHSEFIDDYREQFAINELDRYVFAMLGAGLRVTKISPIREHSYGLLVERSE